MKLILLGLILWIGPHYLKRLAPNLHTRLGQSAKALVTLASFVAIFLMVRGYQGWDSTQLWQVPMVLRFAAIPVLFFAIYLFVASGAKTRVTRDMQHPQLTATMIWAATHLILAGSMAGLLLFGGLFGWAWGQIALINRNEKTWSPAKVWPFSGEARALIVAAIAFAVVVVLHGWLGPSVFATS